MKKKINNEEKHIEIPGNTELTMKLTATELVIIGHALDQLPHGQVKEVATKITEQLNKQLNKQVNKQVNKQEEK